MCAPARLAVVWWPHVQKCETDLLSGAGGDAKNNRQACRGYCCQAHKSHAKVPVGAASRPHLARHHVVSQQPGQSLQLRRVAQLACAACGSGSVTTRQLLDYDAHAPALCLAACLCSKWAVCRHRIDCQALQLPCAVVEATRRWWRSHATEPSNGSRSNC
jgi:hypothetical protein